MRTIRKHALILTVSGFALAALPGAAFAQDSAEDDGGLGEIVVTAQRSEQKLLDVPLSISATSGEQLTASGIRAMNELQLTTPGFVPSNSSGYNQMFIRGIGNAIFVGADPSVATFIDDVPRVFGTLVNNFVDVERVEIIKGAPGALYGRNATGGAVNIITRQPSTDEFSGAARISFGTKETFQGSAFVNVPLGDSIAMTMAGERRKHGGYVKNLTPDAEVYTPAMFTVNNVAGPGTASFFGTPAATAAYFNSGLTAKKAHSEEDFWAVSGKLLFKFSDRFKLTLAADYSKKDDDTGNSGYNITPTYAPNFVLPTFLGFAGATGNTAAFGPLAVTVNEKFATAQRGSGFARLKDWGVSATAKIDLDGVELTSITSYRKNQSEFLTELGSLPFNMLEAHVPLEKKTFYQELRAVSTGEGPLHWIVGASYLRAQFDGGLFTTILRPLVLEAPSGTGGYVTKNWSAYAQFTYDVSDNFSVMLSGRYVDETNNARSLNPITNVTDPFRLKESKFLPAATLSYKLAGGGNIYARYAKGYKAGGIVPVVPLSIFPDPLTQGGAFRGETINTYEVGVRAPLMDNRVNVTAAFFYNDYKNVHVAAHARNVVIPGTTRTYGELVTIAVVNAGSARTYGAEASINARVADPLTVGASVGYLNAKYKQLVIPATNPVLDPLNLSNTRMINSPEWQVSLNANLDTPVSDNLRLVGNIVGAWTDEVLWQASALPGFLPDSIGNSYWLVNAKLGVKSDDGNWELAAYAKNLFNAGYSTFGNSSSSYGNILLWGDPRIIGMEANFKF